ncbi:pyridoxine 5'-phosphate synthase [Rhodomicrobium sp. Az07]|uniref:pyridoxine 5'-phosphate synthase n=1 Tax=Rhodomicrobium sp. Az07 TaxID=2839034 RepID=UPI001BEB3804|nr:pyridoxine 5'-phosphate synthase [Rhodomicrobium sp. Az07]MBT3071033.1 pyridoxine 5'-phosphate synthase [Rhodomicrobium sp. Az07]
MPEKPPVRLGLNIDHVATLRNARGGARPDPIEAARIAVKAGADGITAHLREDRRHIRDEDIRRIKAEIAAPLNLEMAATEEMTAIALATKPHACCLVPERRQELTTEGGLDAVGGEAHLLPIVKRLGDGGIRVSLFIDPEPRQIEAAVRMGAPVVELHTGQYCDAWIAGEEATAQAELDRLAWAATLAASAGLEVHAGHGLDFETATHLAALPDIRELNIGHVIIGEAVLIGLPEAIRRMRAAIADGVEKRLGAHAATQQQQQ